MKLINDFIISMIESKSKIKIIKIKKEKTSAYTTRLYMEYIDQNKNELYISTIVYDNEDEEIKKMVDKIKEKTEDLKKITLNLHQEKYNHIIYKALDYKSKMGDQKDEFSELYKNTTYSALKIEFTKYIQNYTRKNKNAKFIEVYTHCMSNFAKDICEKSTIK